MKKIKKIILLGIVGIVIIGGIAIWASVAAVKQLAATTSEIYTSQVTQEKLQTINTEIKRWNFQPLDCWGKVQSLTAFQTWIEKPVIENLRNLKIACLDIKPSNCQGDTCDSIKQLINTAEN